jgi:large subunit ribosomal protein L22
MKRIRPAPMGRAYRYQRRLTHIVLSVAERAGADGASLVTRVEEPETAGAKKTAGKKAAAARVTKKAEPKATKKAGAKPGKKA